METYGSLSHTTWECKYHVVFVPKYRPQSLFYGLRKQPGPVFRDLALQRESRVEEGHLRADSTSTIPRFPVREGCTFPGVLLHPCRYLGIASVFRSQKVVIGLSSRNRIWINFICFPVTGDCLSGKHFFRSAVSPLVSQSWKTLQSGTQGGSNDITDATVTAPRPFSGHCMVCLSSGKHQHNPFRPVVVFRTSHSRYSRMLYNPPESSAVFQPAYSRNWPENKSAVSRSAKVTVFQSS